MDFETLKRRELQSLCKLNKIPANLTNIAMVDALKSLETVEGVEEFLNPSRPETAELPIESPERIGVTSSRVLRTCCRTSTRKIEESESLSATTTEATCHGVMKQLAGKDIASELNKCEDISKAKDLVYHEKICIPISPVGGFEESLKPSRSETAGLPIEVTSPRVLRTSCMTSTRKKAKIEEAESLLVTENRVTHGDVMKQLGTEVSEVLKTPLVSCTRKKSLDTSSHQYVVSELNNEDITKNEGLVNHENCIPSTPVVVASTRIETVKKVTSTVQRVYSTRRSSRLTAKKSEEPCVMESEKREPVMIDLCLDEDSVSSEKDSGNPISEKSVEPGSASMETLTGDNVGEGSVENNVGFSKEKVKNNCNEVEKVTVIVLDESDETPSIEKVVHVNDTLANGEENVEENMKVKSGEIYEQLDDVDFIERHNVMNEVGKFEEKSGEVDNLKPDSEGICNLCEDGYSGEKQMVADDKTDVNEEALNVSVKEHDAFVVSEEHTDKILVEADGIDSNAISQNPSEPSILKPERMQNEVLECNGAPTMAVDMTRMIHLNTENPSELSKLDNVAEVITKDGVEENISRNTDDLVNPNKQQEASMNLEEPQESLMEEMPTIYDHLNQEPGAADVSFLKEQNQYAANANDDVIDHPPSISKSQFSMETSHEVEKVDVVVMDESDQNPTIEKVVHTVASGEERIIFCGEVENVKVKSGEIYEQLEDMDLEERHNNVMNEVENFEEKSEVDEIEDNISINTVDFVNPNKHQEESMDLEAQECLMDEMGVEVVKKTNQEPHQVTHDESVPEENQLSVNANDDVIDHMPLIKKMSEVSNSRKRKLDEVVVEENEENVNENDKKTPKSLNKKSNTPSLRQLKKKLKASLLNSPISIKISDNKEKTNIQKLEVTVKENEENNKQQEDEKKSLNNSIPSLRQLKKQLKAFRTKYNKDANKDEKVCEARPALRAV